MRLPVTAVLSCCFSIGLSGSLLAAPPAFGGKPLAFKTQADAPVVAAYVPGWEDISLLDRIQPGSLSHVLYAFLRICGPGQLAKDEKVCAGRPEFSLTDGETERRFDAGFLKLKQRLPKLQVLASVGGWGGSDGFFHLAADAAKRKDFASAVVRFLREHPGFDGVDIDWEHPGDNGSVNGVKLGSAADGQGYADLMDDLRAAVDALGRDTGRRYLVTTAVNPTSAIVDRINFQQAAKALDLVFMMSYDYYGAWSPDAGHHTALKSQRPGDESLERSVQNLERAGVSRKQLVAGVAMYGRGFAGVSKPVNGASRSGPYPADGDVGAVTYRALRADRIGDRGQPAKGWQLRHDPGTGSWSLYEPKQQIWIAFDDPRGVLDKARFARRAGLAGLFAWELSQDYQGELLNAMNLGLGKSLR